jgi:hypothetical protein
VPTLLLPADVVVTNNDDAFILGLPPIRPSAAEMLDEPWRAIFLPPEQARGVTAVEVPDRVRYFLGAFLLLCCHLLENTAETEELLVAAAAGVTFAPAGLRPSLPFWVQRMDATRSLLSLARTLCSADPEQRRRVVLPDLSRAVRHWIDMMDPLAAARALRNGGRAREAFALLQDTLLTDETYEVLLEAGEVAGRVLGLPLEEVDLLERAIALEPDDQSAIQMQLVAITAVRQDSVTGGLVAANPSLGTRLDERIQRNWDALGEPARLQHECDFAEYLLWRGRFDAAADLIYPRLFADGTYLAQKFELNIAYARALLGQGRLTEAEGQIKLVTQHVREAYLRQAMTAEDHALRRAVLTACEMELQLRLHGGSEGAV